MATAEVAEPTAEPEAPQEPVEAPVTPDEPEEGSELDGDESQPQEPAEPQDAGLSEKDLNAALTKLDKEATRHRARVSEIMGEDAVQLLPCPLCPEHLAGLRFPVAPSEDQWAAITAAVYGEQLVEYRDAEYVRMCDSCDGLGKIATHSKVPGRTAIDCRTCNGFGYTTRDTAPVAVLQPPEPGTAPVAFAAPSEPPPDTDPFGRTRDDPNFGTLPGYER